MQKGVRGYKKKLMDKQLQNEVETGVIYRAILVDRCWTALVSFLSTVASLAGCSPMAQLWCSRVRQGPWQSGCQFESQ